MSSVGSACFAHRSPHYSFAFRRLPPRLSETAPHTIPSHVTGCLRVFGRPLPTLFRRSSSVGSGSLGDSDVHPSPFVPPLSHTTRSVAVGSAALPLSGDVTLFCACHRLALPVSETTAHMTLSHFISCSASFGDRCPHDSVACHRLVPSLSETTPHTIPLHFIHLLCLSGRPLAPVAFARHATDVGMYCMSCLLQ